MNSYEKNVDYLHFFFKKSLKFLKILLTIYIDTYYNYFCRKTRPVQNADVAELVDAQDLKSCGG